VDCDVLHVKSAAEAGREVGRAIGGMRQTHRGPMLLVVQVPLFMRVPELMTLEKLTAEGNSKIRRTGPAAHACACIPA